MFTTMWKIVFLFCVISTASADSACNIMQQTVLKLQNTTEELEAKVKEQVTTTEQLQTMMVELVNQLDNSTKQLVQELKNQQCLQKAALQYQRLGLVYLNLRLYYVSDTNNKVPWSEARDFCKTYGMELASVESDSENNAIKEYLDNRFDVSGWDMLWLGGTDQAREGHWIWTGTGKPFKYAHFGSHFGNSSAANCLGTCRHGSDLYWDDYDCSSTLPFICEMDPPCV